MRNLSFRSKQRLRKLLIAAAITAVVLVAAAICLVVYLERYIVYTADGAHLDFSGTHASDTAPDTLEPLPDAPLEILDGSESSESSGLTRLSGLYVTVDMLSDPDAVLAAVDAQAGQTAVLLDLKSIYGNFYYNTTLTGAGISSAVDAAAVDSLLTQLAGRSDVYRIARIPAFRDSAYALANQACGLPLASGALWMDEENCYWLDPGNELVLSYLSSIVRELRDLGFDEVVFSDFTFPNSANIQYDGDRSTALLEAAARLQANVTADGLVFSLETTDPALAAYATRVYCVTDDGADVADVSSALSSVYSDLPASLVFLTASRDTRFSQYGLLQPAIAETES